MLSVLEPRRENERRNLVYSVRIKERRLDSCPSTGKAVAIEESKSDLCVGFHRGVVQTDRGTTIPADIL